MVIVYSFFILSFSLAGLRLVHTETDQISLCNMMHIKNVYLYFIKNTNRKKEKIFYCMTQTLLETELARRCHFKYVFGI